MMEFFSLLTKNSEYEKIMKSKYGINKILKSIPENSYPIKCKNGIFLGKNKENIISYKGIPFAKPPIKNLRFHKPERCEDSNIIREAYYFEKSPIQINDPGEMSSYYEKSEDCLYLNIWKYNDNKIKKPILIFIHGGAFGYGGTVDPLYDCFNFVKNHNDIILITITYRVSILGFLDLTQIKGGENYKESANLGILDQIQALKWIKENINFFGGDENNITLFGESAGAASVTILPFVKESKGLFNRIISQSGSFAFTISKNEGKSLIDRLKKVMKKNDLCVDDLMKLNENDIININNQLNLYCLPPIRDDIVIPINCYEKISECYKDIDILIGSNENEINYWIIECGYFFLFNFLVKIFVENIIKFRLDKNNKNIFKKYENVEKNNPYNNFLNDLFFRCPANKIAELHSLNGGNVYLYYWTYPSSIPNFGACHAIELAYVFNNLNETHYIGNKNINYDLSKYVQEMWVNFAKFGNPSIEKFKWEKFNIKNKPCMILGNEIKIKYNLLKERDKIIEHLLNKYIPYDYFSLSFNIPLIHKWLFIIFAIIILIIACLFRK